MTAPTPPASPQDGPQTTPFVPGQNGAGAWTSGAAAAWSPSGPAPAAPTGSLAEWGPRAVGLLIDTGVGLGIYLAGVVLASIVGAISSVLGLLVLLGALGLYLAWFVYNLVEQGQTGQTLGKRVVGLKLVRESDGQLTGAGLSVGRGFAHALEFGIGWLFPLVDPKKQTFADKICSTVVVTAPKADWRPALLRGR